MMAADEVCDGCWIKGVCIRQTDPTKSCKCSCDGGRVWRHADDPVFSRVGEWGGE